VLPTRAARAVRVDPEIRLVDLDVDVVVHEGAHDHLREARVAPVRLVERAQADEPVHAALGLQDPVRVLTVDGEGGRFEARLLARGGLDHLGPETAVGRPPEVHAEEDLRPVLRVRAAGTRLDRHDRVPRVVIA
jgi:hypothetical protein